MNNKSDCPPFSANPVGIHPWPSSGSTPERAKEGCLDHSSATLLGLDTSPKPEHSSSVPHSTFPSHLVSQRVNTSRVWDPRTRRDQSEPLTESLTKCGNGGLTSILSGIPIKLIFSNFDFEAYYNHNKASIKVDLFIHEFYDTNMVFLWQF